MITKSYRISTFADEKEPFIAGIEVNSEGMVVLASPILEYMKGWTTEAVRELCANKGWKIEVAQEYRTLTHNERTNNNTELSKKP